MPAASAGVLWRMLSGWEQPLANTLLFVVWRVTTNEDVIVECQVACLFVKTYRLLQVQSGRVLAVKFWPCKERAKRGKRAQRRVCWPPRNFGRAKKRAKRGKRAQRRVCWPPRNFGREIVKNGRKLEDPAHKWMTRTNREVYREIHDSCFVQPSYARTRLR